MPEVLPRRLFILTPAELMRSRYIGRMEATRSDLGDRPQCGITGKRGRNHEPAWNVVIVCGGSLQVDSSSHTPDFSSNPCIFKATYRDGPCAKHNFQSWRGHTSEHQDHGRARGTAGRLSLPLPRCIPSLVCKELVPTYEYAHIWTCHMYQVCSYSVGSPLCAACAGCKPFR